jgi:hypothetical protein
MAMIVLDTLSGDDDDVGLRWKRLLTDHGLSAHDAEIVCGTAAQAKSRRVLRRRGHRISNLGTHAEHMRRRPERPEED